MAPPTKSQRVPTRVRTDLYRDHVRGRGALIFVVLTGLLAILYWAGVLEEGIAAALFAAAVILGCCAFGAARLADASIRNGVAIAIAAAVAVVAAIPVIQTLYPGRPAAHGRVLKPGDGFDLPQAAHGPVRVLLHGKLGGQGASAADVVLDLDGHGSLHGQLTRTLNRARVGRRGTGMVVHEHNSEYIGAEVPAEAHRMTLRQLQGTLTGPLDVSVFPERVPMPIELALCALLLLLAAGLCARAHASSAAAGALGCALAFGIMVSRMASPDEAVGPEFGALFVSIVCATLAAAVLVAALGRVVPRATA